MSLTLNNQLKACVPGGVATNVLLRDLSRWRVGGIADYLVRPRSTDQLSRIVEFLSQNQTPFLVIGHTSNLLFSDAGIRGVVIQISDAMSDMQIDDTIVNAQAGVWVPHFSSKVGRSGLSGIEHTIGIPGTLGGLICMNGGSQRKGIGDQITTVECIDQQGNIQTLNQKDCRFAYRQSRIQSDRLIVTRASFKLTHSHPQKIRQEMLSILKSRRHKFPLKLPNCGSVFVSDPAMYERFGPPGKVIETCGLKGTRIGEAEISEAHANFIVNTGKASSHDILQLIHLIRETAFSELNCRLYCEVRFVTENADVIPADKANLTHTPTPFRS